MAGSGMAVNIAIRAICTSFRYYANRVTSRAAPSPLESIASRTLKICDGLTLAVVRPYVQAGQLGRIRDGTWHTARQIIEEQLSRSEVVLHPLLAHEFRDAFLIDGSVYLDRVVRIELRSAASSRSTLRNLSVLPVEPQCELEQSALVAGVAGSTWFGHWLADELPLHMLASRFAQPVAHVRAEHRDESYYAEALRLPRPSRVGTARISRLTIIDEFGQNPSKARRYWQIREQFSRGPRGAHRVFLSRGNWGTARLLRNEQELIERFSAEGYSIIEIATASTPDLLAALRGASVVVSVEGSHLVHLLYSMMDFGTMIILNPPERTLTTVAEIAPYCGLHAGMFICTSNEDGSFSADVNELREFIDAAINDARARQGELERFLDSLREISMPEPGWSNA
jgi:Glycosyltransferase 61